MNEMRTYINLIESAEQLDEFNFKKAAATAMAVGALAGAPQDAQADNSMSDPQLDKPVATQQIEQPREIKYNHKQLKQIAGIGGQGGRGFWGLGMKKDELMTAVKNIHSNKPADIGEKTSSLQFGKMIDAGSVQYQNVHIEYENGYLEMVLARGGQLKSLGGFASTDVGTEPMYIFGNVKFVVGAEIPAEKPPEEFDF